ncbi:MAG: heparan-alpha-glucosaminide N-acetyltransferase [Candidatus Aenigmarchaeota archaeon]|nr:heparan-alpha-glucosaminide N-acetyltransferase [Candidatus Aenigmarchaeota archaeon]
MLKFLELAKPAKGRLWEIDTIRGVAIVLMVISNFVYDLYNFGSWQIDIFNGFWWVFPRVIVATFVLLVGLSLNLSYVRVRHKNESLLFKKYLMRGIKIFLWGVAITAVTWMFLPQGVILFGVLHFIGVGIILAYPFLRYPHARWLPWLAILLIIFGIWLHSKVYDWPWLFWLGLIPKGFSTFDYIPILPWFGVLLLGLWVGGRFYPEGKRTFALADFSNLPSVKFLCLLGRNSLLIYLIHQPILVGSIYLFWL